MGCFGSKEDKEHSGGDDSGNAEPYQSRLSRNDGGIIGRHGHVGAVMVGLGAGNYGKRDKRSERKTSNAA